MRATKSDDTILDGAFVPDQYIARILPANEPRRLESLKWLRDMAGRQVPDSTPGIRQERDRR